VQKWKNVLLQSKDPNQLERYWAAFQKHEDTVDVTAQKLATRLPDGETQQAGVPSGWCGGQSSVGA
jgi:hypothetical protein